MKLVGIGFGNMVNAERIIAVVSPDSNPVKRMIATGKDNGMLIDATQGRKTKSVILMDSDHIVLSYLSVESLETKIGQEELE
ncbi:MAG: DUF370 domain-containing protein [Ruminococcaceae bacterium]|nr:DUF370 domain-containing protein [Oscillospiraceae bacterium]